MKRMVYHALCGCIIAMSIMGCSRNVNYQDGRPAESGTVSLTGEHNSESETVQKETQTQEGGTGSAADNAVPGFLLDIADEVVIDEADFTLWDSYSMHKSYEMQGFKFCELLRDGVRSRAIYTESGIVIVSEERAGKSSACTVMYKGSSMTLEDDIFGVFGDKLKIYLYDFDMDGNGELVINSLGDGYTNNSVAVIRMEPWGRIEFEHISPEEFVSNMEITDVTRVSPDEIEYGYTVEDWYGNLYDGSAEYTNYIEGYDIPENEGYSVAGWDSWQGVWADDGCITYSYMPYMASEDFNVVSRFAAIKLNYTYDAEKDAFVCNLALMDLGKEKESTDEKIVELKKRNNNSGL